MAYTNFLGDGIAINGAPVLPGGSTAGVEIPFGTQYYFVHNGRGLDGNDGTFDTPFKTLDFAIGRCTAARGHVIVLLPGHAETISAAGGVAADVSGITIVGLGSGGLRPTFTLGTSTAASVTVSAANITFRNILFVANLSNIVTCFNITSTDCWIDQCEFVNAGTNLDFLTPIKATSTTDNNADGLRVTRSRWITADSDDLEFIEINANLARLVVEHNFVVNAGTASPLVLSAGTKVLTGASIRYNFLQNAMTANALFVSNGATTNTGIIAHNRVGHADVTGAHSLGITGLGMRLFDNLSVSTDSLSGFVLPAIDVDL